MKIQYFIPIVCSLMFGCHTDSGVNPSEKYSRDMPASYKVKRSQDLPKCDDSMEGRAILVDDYHPKKVYVCADKVWAFLREMTLQDEKGLNEYSSAYDSDFQKSEFGSITDYRDGQSYKTVKINSQVWFAENLRYGSYDNANICHIEIGTNGCLYTWNDLFSNGSSNKGLCPNEFHVPSKNEWMTLMNYVGGYASAGIVLQAKDQVSSDAVGFTIVPSGYYYSNDSYYNSDQFSLQENFAPFWTSTEDGSYYAYAVLFSKGYASAEIRGQTKKEGYAVRCIRD